VSRLSNEQLFRVVPGRDPLQEIGDDTLRLQLDAEERARLARQSDPGYVNAPTAETTPLPESV